MEKLNGSIVIAKRFRLAEGFLLEMCYMNTIFYMRDFFLHWIDYNK